MSQTESSGRSLPLDVLRGVAILLVLVRHSPIGAPHAVLLKYPFSVVWHLGWTGVDLFFVLSGFLIGGLLFHEIATRQSLDIKRFIIRRGFKIWPSYYLNIVIGTFLVFILLHRDIGETVREVLPNFLHVQNYFFRADTPVYRVLGPTWSLAIEEHFYLLLPLVLYFVTKGKILPLRRMDLVPPLIIGVIALSIIFRGVMIGVIGFDADSHGRQTHLRIDGLAFGVLLAYFYHFDTRLKPLVERYRYPLLAVGLALIAPAVFLKGGNLFFPVVGFTMLYVGYGCLMLVAIFSKPNESKLGRAMSSRIGRGVAYIGYYSYTIYLWHMIFAVSPMVRVAKHVPKAVPEVISWLALTAVYLAISVFVGVIGSKIVDTPMLAIRDRLYPARSKALKSDDAKPA